MEQRMQVGQLTGVLLEYKRASDVRIGAPLQKGCQPACVCGYQKPSSFEEKTLLHLPFAEVVQ